MIHYHGTPITPRSRLLTLAGRSFCVRYGEGRDLDTCLGIGEGVMLDNGAYSFWQQGTKCDSAWWEGYYDWCVEPLEYPTTWAVIPDVIDGDEAANDALLGEWPYGDRGAPVWHMHESIDRLLTLVEYWPRVCIGSSGQWPTPGKAGWQRRMDEAMNALCGNGPVPVWLHMLKGLNVLDLGYPFSSADSTNIAQNSHSKRPESAAQMAARLDAIQCPARWTKRGVQASLEAA